MKVTIGSVMQVRDRSKVSLNECKLALEEAGGDVEAALIVIQKKGLAKSMSRAGKVASEGYVHSYVHHGRIGVMVEINCETDFTARSESFRALCETVAMQVAAMTPMYVSPGDVGHDVVELQTKIFEGQLLADKKPQAAWAKIIPGKFTKWYSDVCLMQQESVERPGMTIEKLVAEVSHTTGEKIVVRRFVRWELGEGIEKAVKKDFAEEVAMTANLA